MANNSTPVSLMQPKTYADANDQFLAWSPASGNDVIVPVSNLFQTVPLVVGTTITVGNSSGVVINTSAITVGGSVIGGGGGYAGGNLVPSLDGVSTLGNTSHRFLSALLSNTLVVGNSSLGTTINSTAFSGQANSALFIGALPAANVVSNAQLSANLGQYQPTVTLGTAVAGLTANAANFIGALPAASVANSSAPAFTTSIEVGSVANNVTANTTAIKVGNSSISATVNSTAFSGQANSALFVGATSAANVVSNAQLTANLSAYQTTAGLSAAVASLSVNNSVNLNGLAAVNYANTSNASIANLASVTLVIANTINLPNTVINSTAFFQGNSTVSRTGTAIGETFASPLSNVSINSTAILVGNGTLNSTINSTAYTGQANSVVFVGTTTAANVVSNGQLQANLANYQTHAGLASNVALLAANNASFLGGLAASGYANTSAPVVGSIEVGTVANNVFINAISVTAGNSTVNATMNSTSYTGTAFTANNAAYLGGIAAANYANNSAPVISSNLTIGTVTANTSGIQVGSNTFITGNSVTTTTVTAANLYPSIVVANGALGLTGQVLLSGGPGSNVYWGPPPSNGASNVAFGNPNQIAFNHDGIETGDANFTWQSTNGLFTVGAIGNSVVTSNHNIVLGNSSVFSTINSTFFSGVVANANIALTANNSLSLGGLLSSNYANTSAPVIATATINSISVGNATSVATVNSTVYTGSSNNALFVGGTSAANVVSNAQLVANLAAYQTHAGLASNVATLPANSASYIGTLAAASVANTSAPQITTSVKVGANVTLSTTSLVIGTTTIDTNQLTIANVAPNIVVANGGVGLTGQVLTSAGPGANVYWAPASNGGGTGNGVYGNPNQIAYNNAGVETGDANFTWQSSNVVMTVGTGAAANTVSVFGDHITIGNTTSNGSINSTAFTGQSNTALNALSLGGLTAVNYANTSSPLILTSVTVGNSTINNSVNSTSYSGVANNALFIGGTSAANVVSNAQLTANLGAYQTTAGLSTAVGALTSNNANFLGGLAAVNFANTSAPVITTTLEVGTTTNNVTVNTIAVKLGNSTIFSTVNSTAFSGQANNTLFVGAASAANVVSNAQLIANLATYALTSSLAGTIAASAANSASFIGTLAAASVANTSAPVFLTSAQVGASGVGANTVVIGSASIALGNTTVASSINSSALAIGTMVINSTEISIGGSATILAGALTIANTISNNASISNTLTMGLVTVGSNNVILTPTTLTTGNSTVNSVINSTAFSGTSNNALLLGGLSAANYANLSSATFTVTAKVGANVVLTTAGASFGNSTVNTSISQSAMALGGTLAANGSIGTAGWILTSGGAGANAYWTAVSGGGAVGSPTQLSFNNAGVQAGDANLTWNAVGSILTIGGAVTNVQISTTSFSGTANNSLNLGGVGASGYANTTTPVIANTVQVGSGFSNGTIINSTAVFMGNSTVFGTINTTNYTGTSNNATNLGGLVSTGYANNTLASILVLAANTLSVGNSLGNTLINATSISVANVVLGARLSANGGVGTAGWVLTSGGAAGNDYWTALPSSGAIGSDKQIAFNNVGVESGDANLTWTTTTGTLTVGNTTVFATHNSTSFSGTSNNSLNLGGLAAANYVNTSVATFTTSANVGAISQLSTTTLTTGNSTAKFIANSSVMQVPGQISANGGFGTSSFVLTSAGAGANAYWAPGGSGSGTPGGLTTQIQFNLAGSFAGDANLTWTTATGSMTFGNTTVNTQINSTSAKLATVLSTTMNTANFTATGNVNALNLNATNNLSVTNAASFGNSTVNTSVNSTVILMGTANASLSIANSVVVKAGSIAINNAIVPTMGMVYGMLCGYGMT